MAKWRPANSVNERTGRGFVPATPGFFGNGDRGDFVEHDCSPPEHGDKWTCHCGRKWRKGGWLSW